jgi:ribosomal protein L15
MACAWVRVVQVIGCNDEQREPVKLTAKGLTVKAHAFTATAVEQIQANGGKCVLLNPVTNEELKMD